MIREENDEQQLVLAQCVASAELIRVHRVCWTLFYRDSMDLVGANHFKSVSAPNQPTLLLLSDHIRGVTHWWSLIPQLEKGCLRTTEVHHL